jgi:hypothetical protein
MIQRFVRALLIVPVALAMLTACGSSDDNYQPTAWGPTISGQVYCAYMVSPAECAGRPGIPMLMPATQPVGYYTGSSDLYAQLFLWHLMYHSWYASPGYYNRYVPTQYRTTYVTKYVTTFDRSYSSQEKSSEGRATYRNSHGKTVSGNKVNTNKLSPPRNNGGSGSKNCGLSEMPKSLFSTKGGGGGGFGGGSRGGSSGGSRSGGGSSKGGNRGSSSKGGC